MDAFVEESCSLHDIVSGAESEDLSESLHEFDNWALFERTDIVIDALQQVFDKLSRFMADLRIKGSKLSHLDDARKDHNSHTHVDVGQVNLVWIFQNLDESQLSLATP